MKIASLCGLLTLSGLAAGQTAQNRQHTLTGDIRSHPAFESKVLGNKRDILVYLPPDYEKDPKRRYPVLYLNDGQNVFDGFTSYIPNEEWRADEAAEALIRTKLIEPIIMVAVPNAGAERSNEYLPTHWTEDPTKFPEMGGKADLYGKMLTDELMPFINKTYRTKTAAKDTAIAGSSLGGIVSLHLGLTRPEAFGKLGVFSPSLWWQDELMTKRVLEMTARPKAKIWMDIGTTEGSKTLPQTQRMQEALEKKGWTLGRDLAVYYDGFSRHNERAWAGRFPAFLMFMYGRR